VRITTATPWAISIAVAAFVVMAGAARQSPKLEPTSGPAQPAAGVSAREGRAPAVSVKALGSRLMGEYVVPLEVLGLLLTAAMLGAVIIAMPERRQNGD
jgi:NADH-quinone oxidoreductase subunit J